MYETCSQYTGCHMKKKQIHNINAILMSENSVQFKCC